MFNFSYKGLVAGKYHDVPGKTKGVDKDGVTSLFRSVPIMDNFQMSLASQCYRGGVGCRHRFEINSLSDEIVQVACRVVKLFCMRLFNVR